MSKLSSVNRIGVFAVLIFSLLVTVQEAQAQQFGGTRAGTFRGMMAYLGWGVAEFTVLNPATDFRMDQGTFIHLGGEKQIGKTGLFITLGFNFMDSAGQTFYDYTELGGTNMATNPGDQLNFDSTHIQLNLGFKFKFFPTSFFRPYGEAGGLFGYHEITYDQNSGTIVSTPAGGNPRLKDGLTGFGYYGEAGVEVDFSELYGIKLAARYQVSETRPFETLNENKVKYEVRAFNFAVLMRF